MTPSTFNLPAFIEHSKSNSRLKISLINPSINNPKSLKFSSKYKLKPLSKDIDGNLDNSLLGSSYFVKLPLLYDSNKGINIPPDLDIITKQNINIFNTIKNSTYNIYNPIRKPSPLEKNFIKVFNVRNTSHRQKHSFVPPNSSKSPERECFTDRKYNRPILKPIEPINRFDRL